ncbi:MAG TPA: amidase [Candidatus Acidoferrum sp.]|nr:amidase [Candidatus Acidoferrum sp.]
MFGEDILYLSVRELGDCIRKKEISPVELAESYLDRSERIGPKLSAFATVTRDLALKQAHAAEAEIASGHYRGPLHGVPYALKDLVAVEGYPTTWGARPFANQRFDYNATIVERLNRAGSVLIGKAAMIELAGGLGYTSAFASLTGPARNPWNTDRWTCGSSSGSGAVVSAALAPWAIGSDTRGSTICPGAWCGISAMRPSFGRVSRHGAMAIAWSMDKLCPMSRTADDCGIILSVIAGQDGKDIDSLPGQFWYPQPDLEPKMPLRIGRLTNAWNHLEPGLDDAVNASLKIMEQNGCHVSDAAIPDGPYEEVAELTIQMEAVSAFQDLIESGRCFELEDPLGRINGYAGLQFTTQDYLQVQRVRTFLQERVDRLFDNYDVLATAGESSAASPIKEVDDESRPRRAESRSPRPYRIEERAPDGISSLCGLPALTVPCGFSNENLPFGVQFIGRATNDHAVIAAARLYQAHTDWERKRPPIG